MKTRPKVAKLLNAVGHNIENDHRREPYIGERPSDFGDIWRAEDMMTTIWPKYEILKIQDVQFPSPVMYVA